jgi:hypothetical protein
VFYQLDFVVLVLVQNDAAAVAYGGFLMDPKTNKAFIKPPESPTSVTFN